MTRTETVRRVGLFSSLGDEEVKRIAELFQERTVSKGSAVFQQGEVGDALYIVESGRLKALAKDHQGKYRILALYGQGDFFGEMALLSDQVRLATISAITDSTLLVLRKEDFESYLENNVSVMRHMLKVISEQPAQTDTLPAKGAAEETETLVGKVITLYSPKGGVGRTTVAVNLATALREATGKQVALVDGSLGFGDVGVMLDLVADKSISDLVPHINRLDYEILDGVMYNHSSGIRVLLAPPYPELAELVTGDHLHIVLAKLRELFDFIIVDTSSALQESTLSILDASDLVLVLTTLEMAALKNVKVFLETTESLGYSPGKVVLAINRSDSTGGISIESVEATVGRKFMASIVSDGRLATHAGNRGVPFVISDKDTRIASDIMELARMVVAVLEGQPPEAHDSPKKQVSLRVRSREIGLALISLRPQSLLLGLGAMLVLSIALLFGNTLVSFALQASNIAYPSPLVAAILLFISAFSGAFATVHTDAQHKQGWALGLVLGLTYGILITLITASVAELTGDSVFIVWPIVLFNIPVYAVLGLAGGAAASLGRRRLGYRLA